MELRTDSFLHNKIVTACAESPACTVALVNPPPELSALMNSLTSNVAVYQAQHPTETFFEDSEDYADINFTNRRFFRTNNQNQRGNSYQGHRGNYSNNSDQQRHSDRFKGPLRSDNTRTRIPGCWICKRPSCRSWKHIPQE